MRFSLGVFLLLLAFTSQAQLAPQSLDSLVQAEVERNQFSGIILLADNGTPIYQRAVGESSSDVAMTMETPMRLASITKAFTSVLIMQLIQDDLLRPETTIEDILPELEIKKAHKITVRDLMLHTSGLPNEPDGLYHTPHGPREMINRTYMIQFPVEVADANGQMQALEWENIVYTDYDWLQTIGVELVAGRNFSEEFSTDIDQAFLVNESMLRYLNDSSLIGRNARMYYSEFGEVLYEKKGQIVGVFKDFHTEDLHSEITPLMVALANPSEVGNYLTNVAVRLRPGDHREQLAALQTAWQETFPNQPFDYVFVEDRLREAYEQEEQLGQILTSFTVLAIFIALLGLLGLAAFTAQQRTKEMGVRKILGASKQHILLLLNREFTWLVLIALLLSVPLAFWLMQGWLEEYPYRIEISVLPYAVAGLSALLLTWLTVSIHSLRAAWRNPADALRDE